MKVVIDTNVLVGSLVQPFGVCAEVVNLVREGKLEPLYDARTMAEYREVLSRKKFGQEPGDIKELLEPIEAEGTVVAAAPIAPLRDLKDTAFLEVAISGGARYLITGNLRDFASAPSKGPIILSPGAFLERLREGKL